jgi:hypothetical protein
MHHCPLQEIFRSRRLICRGIHVAPENKDYGLAAISTTLALALPHQAH